MTDRSIVHASFTIERTYPVAPSAAYAAFAELDRKGEWFKAPPGWVQTERSMDFREGGLEIDRGGPTVDEIHGFRCVYYDIVPDERIVYAYDMDTNGTHASLSVATIEFAAVDGGTRVTITEQGAFLDGIHDADGREEGTQGLMDQLGTYLAG